MATEEISCVICDEKAEKQESLGGETLTYYFDCTNCGKYAAPVEAYSMLSEEIRQDSIRRAAVSHEIFRRQQEGHVKLTCDNLSEWASNDLPTPGEQIENIILWLGESTRAVGISLKFATATNRARFGTVSKEALNELRKFLLSEKLIELAMHGDCSLTIPGWGKYHELRSGRTDSMTGFMAMRFAKDTEIAYRSCFIPAARRAGFELKTVNEEPEHGLIDDQIRVGIFTSRFTVADLTHDNSGAYFEAGFAEGNGKPVFYTCKREFFENSEVHFDAEHQVITMWSEEEFKEAGDQLTAMIRRKFPDEAKMED